MKPPRFVTVQKGGGGHLAGVGVSLCMQAWDDAGRMWELYLTPGGDEVWRIRMSPEFDDGTGGLRVKTGVRVGERR